MDPIRNPYAPGAGQRPPELAGRDEQLAAFDVVLERVSRGRPERSLVLTGLRGLPRDELLARLRRGRDEDVADEEVVDDLAVATEAALRAARELDGLA